MMCIIANCEKPAKHKGLCSMHYKRQWRHGDANFTVIAPKGSNVGKICSEENCNQEVQGNGLCKMHGQRMRRYGRIYNINTDKGTGTTNTAGYRLMTEDGKRVYEHTLVAEKALGHKLPPGAVVHHWDEDPSNNEPSNLLICPSQAYHLLIHKRMKQRKAATLTNLNDLLSRSPR